jgi:class 3 adenylate cyclase
VLCLPAKHEPTRNRWVPNGAHELVNSELFKRIVFDESDLIECLALFIDLEGYSGFVREVNSRMSASEGRDVIHKYLRQMFSALNTCIHGGDITVHDPYWLTHRERVSWEIAGAEYRGIAEPNHFKFQGDGALYVWENLAPDKRVLLVQRLLGLRRGFAKIRHNCASQIRPIAVIVDALPAAIRFGLSWGPLVRLAYKNNPENTATARQYFEYVGYDVNLAARLEGYCKKDPHKKGLGFVASHRVWSGIPVQSIRKNGLLRLRAVCLKGCEAEDVLVDESEYRDYRQSNLHSRKFEELS